MAEPFGTAPAPADWLASLPPSRARLDAAAWALAATLVGGVAAGGVALTLWLDLRPGRDTRNEAALLIDVPPPPPAVSAVTETVPEAPRVEAPDSPDPGGRMTEAPVDPTIPDRMEADRPPERSLPPPTVQPALPPLPAAAGIAALWPCREAGSKRFQRRASAPISPLIRSRSLASQRCGAL